MLFLKQKNRVLILILLGFLCWGKIAKAQVDEACWTKIRQAEEDYTLYPYTECQFDAGKTALLTWGELAKEHKYKRALYELCRRYARYTKGKELCQEAILSPPCAAPPDKTSPPVYAHSGKPFARPAIFIDIHGYAEIQVYLESAKLPSIGINFTIQR